MKAVTLDSIVGVIRARRGFKTFLSNFINECEIVDVIPIPEEATNGNMIKTMFPDVEIVEIVHTREFSFVKVRFNGMPDTKIFDLDWWNAPYRLEGRK
jgi:hypothetical protein